MPTKKHTARLSVAGSLESGPGVFASENWIWSVGIVSSRNEVQAHQDGSYSWGTGSRNAAEEIKAARQVGNARSWYPRFRAAHRDAFCDS